jgi:outer membrane lipopolysaccharide assembly protein LptE/RlpB
MFALFSHIGGTTEYDMEYVVDHGLLVAFDTQLDPMLTVAEDDLFHSLRFALAQNRSQWAIMQDMIDLNFQSLIVRCTYNGLDCLHPRLDK